MRLIVKVIFTCKDTVGYGFYSKKEYWYILKSDKDFCLKEGDYAVIESADTRHTDPFSVVKISVAEKYSVDRVQELEEEIGSSLKTKEFIGTADLSSYFAEKERLEKIKHVNSNIVNRFKQVEKLALYKQVAETDPIMKALLEELDSLGGTVTTEDLEIDSDLY